MMKKLLSLFVALIATCSLWASNVITYTASSRLEQTKLSGLPGLHTNAFNVAITGHTFSNGTGTITFAGEVTSIDKEAFYECSELTSITIPSSVTSISGEYGSAFYGCSSLTAVYITDLAAWCGIAFGGPIDNPLYYANHLYLNGSEVTNLVIPNSVTNIGNYAFEGCSGLTSVTIPDSVTSIGEGTFEGCSGLTSITIPESVTSIEDRAFNNCSGLTSITIPNSVTSIGKRAFFGCSSLTSITIPNSVTSIGDYAFSGCSSLPTENNIRYAGTYLVEVVDKSQSTYTIKEGTKLIGTEAFCLCSRLTSITIPNSVTNIGYKAFYGCSGLTSITIPESVTSIGIAAFNNCSNLKVVYNLSSLDIVARSTSHGGVASNALVVHTTLLLHDVITYTAKHKLPEYGDQSTGLRTNAFNASVAIHTFSNGIGTILFTQDVTSIGDKAFSWCTGLTSINIPESVTSIGGRAFENCSGLTSINIPESVTSIGFAAFNDCSGLTSITVESGNTTYDSRDNCNAIIKTATNTLIAGCQYTTIPNSVTSIEDWAFENCSGLTSITIPNSVTSIGDRAFFGCSGLTSIVVDSDNTTYDSRNNCNAIIETATNTLIAGCQYTTIPNSVTSIGEDAFAFCSGLTSVTIPNSVTSIGDWAFENCPGLTSIAIPNSVTSIGSHAFSECSGLTSVTIPNSVTSIGGSAFTYCTGLTFITCEATIPPTCEGSSFYGITKSIPLYVPTASISAYQSAHGWRDFTNIRPILNNGHHAFFTNPNGWNNVYCYVWSGSTQIFGDWPGVAATYTNGYYVAEIPEGMTPDDTWMIIWNNGSGSQTGDMPYVDNGLYDMYGVIGEEKHCGLNLIWDFDVATGTLMISGTGNMDAWPYEISVPWHSLKESITQVIIDEGATNIGDLAFKGCTNLQSVTIPNSVTSIGVRAFYGCSSITSITIPEAVEHVYDNAFIGCTALTSIVWNARNVHGSDYTRDSVCYVIFEYKNSAVTSFIFGPNVQTIPIFLCDSMLITNVTIPNSVTSIEEGAFSDCSNLMSVTIGSSVTSIGGYAFDGCTNLRNVICHASEPPVILQNTFSNYNINLNVPCDYLDEYKFHAVWGSFRYIECIDAEESTVTTTTVTPSTTEATFAWPTSATANTYTLTITKDGVVFCTLTFNANGQLLNITFAPGRDGATHAPEAELTATGYQFTVTGLESGSTYAYTLDAKDAGNNIVANYSGTFTTTGGEMGVESVNKYVNTPTKVVRDGQVLIQRGDRIYDLRGQEVK